MKSQSPSLNKKTLGLFWKFTRPNPFLFWYGTLGAMVATLTADILPPLVVAKGFNHLQHLIANNQPIVMNDFWPYILWYGILMVASLALWRTEAYCVWKYMIIAKRRIAEHLFDHLQSMGSRFHADRFGGALVSQVNKFLSAYDRFIADFTWSIATGFTALIASLIVLFLTSPIYATIFSMVILLYFIALYFQMKKQVPYNRAAASSESDLTAKLADNITNISTVRAFAGENFERELFSQQAHETSQANTNLMKVQLRNELFSNSSVNIMDMLAFSIGIIAITKFHAPFGTLYLVVTYTLSLTHRLWQAMFVMRNINRCLGDAADMTEILQLEPEVKDPADPEPANIHDGTIELQNVTFSYPESPNDPLFKKLNLKIKPGEKVGLVGHSGGGKTTVTRLLLRFMDIQEGSILIDGQDITQLAQHDLRSHIAYVPQEPLLFHRTIKDNIRYGNLQANEQAIMAVANKAHADEFVKKLSKGYETFVGERGVKLSGGQRQRIAIARAMLKNAPILVLDEATSALDSQSEVLIQDALWKLMENRTAIVIAHRLSTVQKMDRIIVLEHGKIVEQGTHQELIQKDGTYAGLWNHQSGGFLEE